MRSNSIRDGNKSGNKNCNFAKNISMKAGILGGGQLGRMLLQAAANYTVETYVLENDPHCPAAHLCHHFIQGDITSFDDVYAFGKKVDVLTIEIENVNIEALEKLEAEGVKVIPKPSAIKIIKNKIKQKGFYQVNEIPTSDFVVTHTKESLPHHHAFLPAVHKLGEGGYDGKGVQIIRTKDDFEKGFDAPSVLEKMVAIDKELAMIVAIAQDGTATLYPPAEMIFDPVLNLLDYQISPAILPEKVSWKAEAIALKLVKAFNSPGLFAVELFVTKDEEVFVNETAPRVHNSGHHSIEANYSSQYDMLWRIMLNYPLGNPDAILPSAIVNILGAEGHSGEAVYTNLDEVLSMDNVFVHLYGKKQTKPGRKMGHVTIMHTDYQDLRYKANKIKHTLKVEAKK
jgi:5-(carboxyamino)imidazole ribonucleotide synthase